MFRLFPLTPYFFGLYCTSVQSHTLAYVHSVLHIGNTLAYRQQNEKTRSLPPPASSIVVMVKVSYIHVYSSSITSSPLLRVKRLKEEEEEVGNHWLSTFVKKKPKMTEGGNEAAWMESVLCVTRTTVEHTTSRCKSDFLAVVIYHPKKDLDSMPFFSRARVRRKYADDADCKSQRQARSCAASFPFPRSNFLCGEGSERFLSPLKKRKCFPLCSLHGTERREKSKGECKQQRMHRISETRAAFDRIFALFAFRIPLLAPPSSAVLMVG